MHRVSGVLGLLVSSALSGCTDGATDADPVRIVTHAEGAPVPEDTYRFTLYGLPEVEDARTVDFRFYWQNQLQWIASYDAEPGGDKERIEVFEIPAGELSFQVLADGERLLSAYTDPSQCRSGASDAVVRVMEPGPGRYGAVEVDIGCTP